ncbi:MAG: hypothetical protein RL417_2065 [Pseudomonadota bacterium]
MSDLFPRLHSKIDRWAFNGAFGRNFAAVFDLQMWCFGCDIKYESGNLLLAYGFERDRPMRNVTGSSHYARAVPGQTDMPMCSIHLWGFALILLTTGCALCLRRHERIPLVAIDATIPAGVWRPHDLPEFSLPRVETDIQHARKHLLIVANELLAYERFVELNTRSTYRPACLRQRRNARSLGAAQLSTAWSELSSKLESSDYIVA